jgi:hypothetical protein
MTMPDHVRALVMLVVGLAPAVVFAGDPPARAAGVAVCLAVSHQVGPPSPVRDAWSTASPTTTGVSLTPAGATGDGASADVAISADGRFVTFESLASDLVASDENGVQDVFVRDTVLGTTARASVSATGAEAQAASSQPAISGDGRFVAFQSGDHSLVPGDTNGVDDVFVWDRTTGTTTRIDVSSHGVQGNATSSDPAVSLNGRFVAFVSAATNLVPHDVNRTTDVFVRDRWHGTTTLVSVTPRGIQGNDVSADPSISDDGGVIVFHSRASNLVPNDDNRAQDIFTWVRASGRVARVNVSTSGAEADERSTDPTISGSGRFVTYGSLASNLVPGDRNGVMDQFVFDRRDHRTIMASVSSSGRPGNDTSCDATISRGGRYVAFISIATNLVPQRTHGWRSVMVRDLVAGTTTLVSVADDGRPGNHASADPRVSEDGRFVAFRSEASNLIAGDGNRRTDVFLRGPFR